MRSYAKLQLDQSARFCTILEKLMGGCITSPPVPTRVKMRIASTYGCEKIYISSIRSETKEECDLLVIRAHELLTKGEIHG